MSNQAKIYYKVVHDTQDILSAGGVERDSPGTNLKKLTSLRPFYTTPPVERSDRGVVESVGRELTKIGD